MELANEVLSNSTKQNEIISFPMDTIDISWMTKAQKKLFDVLKIEENRNKNYKDIYKLAGYNSKTSWYEANKDKRFADLLEIMGVAASKKNNSYQPHSNVSCIKNPKERNEYVKNDIWDMRKLFEEYPRHRDPGDFKVNFTKISNIYIRENVKRYFKNMLSSWKPRTFNSRINDFAHFFNSMYKLFPNINLLGQLERNSHIEPILLNMECSQKQKKRTIKYIKTMFEYMYFNKWSDIPSLGLLNKYDIPVVEESLPRPIPPNIKIQLDDYIENIIMPLLEQNKDTPFIEAKYWDLIIIIRNTGRRFEDISHLIAEHNDTSKECLQYDLDGDTMLYLDHRIAKIPKDLRIPLAHLQDSRGNNIVEKAILRQRERVKDLPPSPDGYKYLFREIKTQFNKSILDAYDKVIVDIISYCKFNKDTILANICNKIPLTNIDGSIYKISAHQFRHTVATEMIDAGIDIYAVKEFLGHSSVAMTEKYIKVYQQRLKKEFKEKLSKSDATYIKNNLSEQEELYDNKWVKNKIIGVFELGDGCCEHPYKMPSCPHMVCKTCVKKKIYPRHLQAVKDTIESETIHKDNALRMGLNEKARI
ncbi:tyrosine-type recombinase/integrase [Clostridium sporogenes]|uniref:tyrosine-type recombinase/integrase n=1 Tax=Clostridium sporogenes TaxID=1509 RepID=UPI003F8FC582